MKKIILLLLLTFGFANAQIIEIPDATFKAELLAASPTVEKALNFSDQWIKIDANNDGEIQLTEAQAVYVLFYVPPPPLLPETQMDWRRNQFRKI